MKVYVCYKEWDGEGCSEPLAAFDNKEAAEKWCEKERCTYYQELEVQS